jgi:hypothetical protein
MSEDETRLAPAAPPQKPASTGTTSSGWLSSSGAIDHGRFQPGALLGGRYRIVGRLVRGYMGEVYRADDLKLGQPVALKFLPPEVDRDPDRLTQLHTEVRMTRQVSHPNVCRVYDIDELDGHTFLSMLTMNVSTWVGSAALWFAGVIAAIGFAACYFASRSRMEAPSQAAY